MGLLTSLSKPSQLMQEQVGHIEAYRAGYEAGVHEALKEAKRNAKPMPTVALADGSVGYPIRWPRTDDCLAAALATCLQVPIENVPDPKIDERLEAGETPDQINQRALSNLLQWLASRRLRIVFHRKIPVMARRRWIGIVDLPANFNGHCLVMDRDALLFDPINPPLQQIIAQDPKLADHMKRALGDRPVRLFEPRHITYGLSFQSVHNPTQG